MRRVAGNARCPEVRPACSEPCEDGSAAVEFIFLSLMLLVPLLYFIITITQIQGASYAAAGAADQAAKVFVRATTERDAYEAMEQAIGLTLSDHGLPREAAVFTVMCEPEECHLSGTAVTVEIRVDVPLPFTPAGLGLDAAHLVARSTQTMSRP